MNDQPEQPGLTAAPADPAATDGPIDADRHTDRPGPEPGELLVALSPRQIVGGFALLAGLIVLLSRRRRGRG